MSQPPSQRSQPGNQSRREYPRTDRPGAERPSSQSRRISGEMQAVHDSPTKYDLDYYQRKVNRLQNELGQLEEELSLAKFKLQKAEDFQYKHQELFKKHQDLQNRFDDSNEQLVIRTRQANEFKAKFDEAMLKVKNLQSEIQNRKASSQQFVKRKREDEGKASSQGQEQKAQIVKDYLRQIDNLRSEATSKQSKLKKQLAEAQFLIQSKQNAQSSLKFKLDRIKNEKNDQIKRLKQNMEEIRRELSEANQRNDQKIIDHRTQLIEETQSRISQVRSLTLDIQNTLIEEIRNLNEAIAKKDSQIAYLLELDRKQIKQNQQIQNDLKAHIRRLQDKIFVIQRQNQIELFNTIDRLKNQYDANIQQLKNNFDTIRNGHKDQVKDLKATIKGLQEQLAAMTKEAKNWQKQHKQLSLDKQLSVKMLSQTIIGLQKLKDEDLKNYTTSMRVIQEDARNKLEDLHSAISSKNTEFEIMTSQINLKNQQINTLLEDIQKLRNQNRQRIRTLETTNAMQLNSLNELITSYKKQVLELKRRVHELESEMSDAIAQYKLKNDLLRQELNNQRDANELLRGRNQFLTEWCKELQGDLKKERMSNVDVLHDHTVSRRQTVQIREQVHVELEAVKDREVQQIKNVFKLEKGRLESDLVKREQQLNSLRAENNRLLTQYKNLQRKVGKPSKLDKGSEQDGKCKATLEAQILLTQNIFNAINRP